MSEKRRDNKGRLLKQGESQRKDGRYSYRYTDQKGERHTVYSWRLVASDKQPEGKKNLPPLREVVAQINKDLSDGIDVSTAKKTTVNDMFDIYIKSKVNVKPVTIRAYTNVYNQYIKNDFGKKDISSIKFSHIKTLYTELMEKHNISVQRINELNSVLHPVFTLAARDDLIRNVPTTGIMSEIKSYSNSARKQKQALTEEQQQKFINFCYIQPRLVFWAPLFIFLLGTGCRISEASGLTWDDCDFEKGVIHIRRGLSYADHGDGYKYHITTTKTNSGTRTIPMLDGVKQALKEVKHRQEKFGYESFTIGELNNFVFTSPKGRPILNNNMFTVLDNALIEYNRIERILAERENRKPDFMPHITPHIFRHTFCSRLFEAGVNVKVIQEIMGHSSAITTLDVYTHITTEQKIQNLSKLDASLNNVV